MEDATKNKLRLIAETDSVCPVCLQRIPAQRIADGNDVYLEKSCPEHGFFRTILWRGEPDYPSWKRSKVPNYPAHPITETIRGCPFDCGLCGNHRQEPCCVLLEVTQRCDLGCPVCFASAGELDLDDPGMDQIRSWYERMLEAGGPFNIQLSGGEPCMRDDLPAIIALGKSMGFTYFQVNTNGLRIASDLDYLMKLKDAGLDVVYLQFDGTTNEIYQIIRGRGVLEQKINVIHNCSLAKIGVVLVPTIVPGVNSGNLGEIIRFALDHFPTVRSIHLQPVSYFGRYPKPPQNTDRITIPELLRGMEEQSGGLVNQNDFQPKGSENSYCSFHATYIIQPDGRLLAVKPRQGQSTCCAKPESAREGLARSKKFVANHWTYKEMADPIANGCSPSLGGWDAVLDRARTHLFSISGMAFQDAWTLDLELLRDCCINVAAPDGKLVPFCAYNLTNIHGRALYRSG